ncbi:MAG: VirB4 family type IV secretion/conjugal transfer ATPase [Micavibrio sp.]|nr:VirB4 family type IV secretion/conjugal transfer ATPase [Micavibrio sp.]
MSKLNTVSVENDPLFLALTRPIMVAGVTYDFMVINAMLTTLAFLATGNLLMFLIGAPIHAVGYVLSLKDPRIFSLLSVALTKHGNCHALNKKLWGCTTYTPTQAHARGRMAIEKTTHGQEALNDKPASQFIPYAAHVDERTISTREGYLLQIIELDGLDFETLDQEDLNQLKNARNNLWKTVADSSISISYHIIRQEITDYPDNENLEGFAKDLDEAWKAKFENKRLFVNKHYLTIIRRPRKGSAGLIAEIQKFLFKAVDKDAAKEELRNGLKALDDVAQPILTTLKRYSPRRLSVYEANNGAYASEALEFLYSIINQDQQNVALPSSDLANYLPAKRFFFGKDALEIRGAERDDITFGAMIGVKEYSPKTFPGMLDHLLRSPQEMVVTQHFSFVERPKALAALKTVVRQMDMAEDAALSLQEDLIEAMDDAESRRIVFGEHQLSILVKGKSTKELDEGVSEIMGQMRDLGLIATREDMYMESCYWSQLPGNFSYQARASMISSQNFASFASFHNFPTGKADNNHWGNHVSMLETTSGAPYFFNFHHRDLGNFNMFGPSGSGKTVLLLFLLAQAQKFKPRSVFFDKDRGGEIFVRACGGHYSVIEPGEPTGFNPLQCQNTESNKAFLRDWLAQLVAPHDGRDLSTNERQVIASAIEENFSMPLEHRRLRYLAELFQGHERASSDSIEARLAPWHSGGARSWMFDNEVDELSLNNPLTGFDLTSILDDPTSRTPALMYMFHRVNDLLNGDKVILFIDEGWKALDDPTFESKIKDWLKTIRKQNGLVGFGSQSVTDASNSRIGDTLIEQCATQIFMPNNKANKDSYSAFGLTDKEFEIIRNTDPASHEFLIKHGHHSVVAKLDLSGMDDVLAVLSGRTETVRLLNKIRGDVGNNPQDWLPVFHEERKKTAQTNTQGKYY